MANHIAVTEKNGRFVTEYPLDVHNGTNIAGVAYDPNDGGLWVITGARTASKYILNVATQSANMVYTVTLALPGFSGTQSYTVEGIDIDNCGNIYTCGEGVINTPPLSQRTFVVIYDRLGNEIYRRNVSVGPVNAFTSMSIDWRTLNFVYHNEKSTIPSEHQVKMRNPMHDKINKEILSYDAPGNRALVGGMSYDRQNLGNLFATLDLGGGIRTNFHHLSQGGDPISVGSLSPSGTPKGNADMNSHFAVART